MWQRLKEDVEAVRANDPAAHSLVEIVLCYPGLHALWWHRIAHVLYRHRLYFPARLISHLARWLTGVEIHPGATIGRGVFIDHGMGVVIGETAVVGDHTVIYHGVTLGATGKPYAGRRHPVIGRHVMLGAGAKVLGPITVGDGARVGAGAVVVRPVPPGATVVGVPAHIVGRDERAHRRQRYRPYRADVAGGAPPAWAGRERRNHGEAGPV